MAKFKIGDKVITTGLSYHGNRHPKEGRRGVVYREGVMGAFGLMYGVKLDGDDRWNLTEEEMRLSNSCAVNVLTSSKKMGAKVKTYDGKEGVISQTPSAGNNFMFEITFSDGKRQMYYERALSNSCSINSSRAIVQKALNAKACNIGNNPNYNPEDGMKFLASHFDMFDMKKAKEMIDDAKKNGVKIPDAVVAKAKKAGIWNSNSRVAKACNANDVNSAVQKIVFSTKRMREITAKVKPWREQMSRMRKEWDGVLSTQADDAYYGALGSVKDDPAKTAVLKNVFREYELARQDGYYNFHSID